MKSRQEELLQALITQWTTSPRRDCDQGKEEKNIFLGCSFQTCSLFLWEVGVNTSPKPDLLAARADVLGLGESIGECGNWDCVTTAESLALHLH